jgi:hypothetical protein
MAQAPDTSTVLTVAVLGFVGVRLATGFQRARTGEGRALVRTIFGKLRWRHFWPVPFVLACVLVVSFALIQLPVLSWGWWTALGGEGNPVTGGSTQTRGTAFEWAIPIAFLVLLLPALPLFALAEERMFRMGAENWSWRRRVRRTVEFGLIHAVIGIPIGIALALSCGGAYFMIVYLREFRRSGLPTVATIESTRAHTAYNLSILSLVLVFAVWAGVDWLRGG